MTGDECGLAIFWYYYWPTLSRDADIIISVNVYAFQKYKLTRINILKLILFKYLKNLVFFFFIKVIDGNTENIKNIF